MAGVSMVQPGSRVDPSPRREVFGPPGRPVSPGPAAVVTLSGASPAPAVGRPVAVTPFRASAQVRNGVAMFGTGAVLVVGTPLMGLGAPAALAQTTAQHKLTSPGSSDLLSQALDLHLPPVS